MFDFLSPRGYKQGMALYKTGHYSQAIEQLSQAVVASPGHAKSHFKLGMCHFKLKQWGRAHASIKKALVLAPGSADWQVQLAHSDKLRAKTPVTVAAGVKKPVAVAKKTAPKTPVTAAADVKKPAAAAKKTAPKTSAGALAKPLAAKAVMKTGAAPDPLIQGLQQLLLQRDLPALDIASLGSVWKNLAPAGGANRKRFMLYLNAERHIAQRDLAALAHAIQELEDGGFSQPVIYFKAVEAYLNANYHECIDLAQVYLFSSKSRARALHLMASAAALAGEGDVAWQAAESAAKLPTNVIAWRYLAALVRTPADGMRLLTLWHECVRSGDTPAYDRYRNNALIDGMARAEKWALAKKIAIDALHHVKSAKNPAVFAKKTLKLAVEDHCPEWLGPFEQVDTTFFTLETERFKLALRRSFNILNQAGVGAFCIRHTLLALERNEFDLAFPGDVTLGVFGAAELAAAQAALVNSGEYLISVAGDAGSIRMKHFSGITVSIHLHRKIAGKVHHEDCGITFANADFALRETDFEGSVIVVPDDTQSYLNEYFFNWMDVSQAFVIVLQSKNIVEIANPELLKIRLYQRLVGALIDADQAAAQACYLRLHDLGEQKIIEKYYKKPLGCALRSLLELKACQPEVVLYLSGLEKVGYQGNMWLPVLERLDVRTAIVVREKGIALQLHPTAIPVFYMETMRDLELLESSGVKTILYPANTQKNIHTLRFFNLNHFFINHGESDKVVNQSKFLMAYDKLLVAGPMAEQRMRDARLPLRPEQVEHVGRPQVELLLQRVAEARGDIRTVLYAPTWEGFVEQANYSSISKFGIEMLKKLVSKKDIKVYFKPHPYSGYNKAGTSGHYLAEMVRFAHANGIVVVDGAAPIFDYMNLSDVMITDISSVLNDYLYTGKPMILTNPRGQTQAVLNKDYPSTPATYVLDEPAAIATLLEDIGRNDTLFDTRAEICRQSLGDIPEGAMVKFNRIVTESVRAAQASPSASGTAVC